MKKKRNPYKPSEKNHIFSDLFSEKNILRLTFYKLKNKIVHNNSVNEKTSVLILREN